MVVIDTETKMIRLESLYASSHIDKIIEIYVDKHACRMFSLSILCVHGHKGWSGIYWTNISGMC